jgi:hypothetical protein
VKHCVYCYLQERKKSKLRQPTAEDMKRCSSPRSRPTMICNGCGALFDKEFDKDGNLVQDRWKNLKEFVKRGYK